MDATKQLTKIDTRLAAARQALREVAEEEREGQKALKSAEGALVDHFGKENADPAPVHLHNELTAARNRVEQPWKERREGKARLVRQLEQERGQFVQAHLGELAAAREGAARAAAESVTEALEAIETATREWTAVEQHYVALLEPVDGVDGRDVPQLHLDAVRSEVRRALERGIPAPLPRSLYPIDEDPTVRSAREKVTNEREEAL